jgi:phospholipase A1
MRKLFLFILVCGSALGQPVRGDAEFENSQPLTMDVLGTPTKEQDSSRPSANPDQDEINQFFKHFLPYEPMYFVGGTEAPNIKFQFSIRYRFINPDYQGPTRNDWYLSDLNFGYSQTSLWDTSNPDEPFFYDSSYRPELFYQFEDPPPMFPQVFTKDFRIGVGHESNGQQEPNHRGMNVAFVQPSVTIGATTPYFLKINPRFYCYLGDISDNPDIYKYQGYCDLQATVGEHKGLQVAAIGRVGSGFNRGSLQLDLTCPVSKFPILDQSGLDLCFDLQYFVGYGDTLLTYNQSSSIVRFGISLIR